MNNILVTGGNGQVATCIKGISSSYNKYNFIFASSTDLDITNSRDVEEYFNNNDISYCINCAAYTAVDKAELEKHLAQKINVKGSKNLAIACKNNNAILIHISTDFVFDGMQTKLYTERDKESPLSCYGRTKLDGERVIASILNRHFILRTSWLYSNHGHNFLKTMLRLGQEKKELKVVTDQIGTPTYCVDLAHTILELIQAKSNSYGLYHFSNEGIASWYDFADAIFKESNINIELSPINTSDYPTPAQRPRFSVMDKSKIKQELQKTIPHWRESLKKCLKDRT